MRCPPGRNRSSSPMPTLLSPLNRRTLWLALIALCAFGFPVLGVVLAQTPDTQAESREEAEEGAEELRQEIEQEIEERIDEERRAAEERREEIQEEIDEVIDEAIRDGGQAGRRVEQRLRSRLHRQRISADTKLSIGGSVTVEEDEVASDVVAIGGGLTIYGEVLGDATAVGGGARIDGRVTGEVVVVGGGVELGPEAEVLGGVTSFGGKIQRADGAVVLGEVAEIALGEEFSLGVWDWLKLLDDDDRSRFERRRAPFRWHNVVNLMTAIVGVVILALICSLILLLLPQTVSDVRRKAAVDPWVSGLTGLLIEVLFVPLLVAVCIFLAISIIGIPLLLLVPFTVLALIAAILVGYTGMAQALGRWTNQRFGWGVASPFLVLLIGIAGLSILSLFGDLLHLGGGPLRFFAYMFAFFGALVTYLACTVGLGALFLNRFGSGPPVAAGALPPLPLPAVDGEAETDSVDGSESDGHAGSDPEAEASGADASTDADTDEDTSGSGSPSRRPEAGG